MKPQVSLLSRPKNPDAVSLCAAAARLCYRPASIRMLKEDAIPRGEEERLFLKVVQSRHWSCLRHANFVFGLEGVSRSFSHQLVRHTVGHSYEQQSQHYILYKEGRALPVVDLNRLPRDDDGAKSELIGAIYEASAQGSKRAYDRLVKLGLPREEARQVIPNGAETRLIWTANLNAVLWMVQVRACRVNCEEILEVAVQVRKLMVQEVPLLEPFLGPTCYTQGVCFEGAKRFSEQCRKPWQTCALWDQGFPRRVTYVSPRGWWQTGAYGRVMVGGSPDEPLPYDDGLVGGGDCGDAG